MTKLKTIIADLELQLAAKMAVGATTGTLASAVDADGVAIPSGNYALTIDRDIAARKEHIVCAISGTAITAIYHVTRQGTLSAGTTKEHRIGAKITGTDFTHLKFINDLLDGTTDLDSSKPLKYDGDPTFNADRQIIDKKYADDVAAAIESAAESYADGIVASAVSSLQSYADGKATAAYNDACDYADGLAFAGVPDAAEDTKGKAELATQTEVNTGTDNARIVVPYTLANTTIIPAGVNTALGGKIPTSYLDTDGTLAANSDTKIPSQKAVKTYVSQFTNIVSDNLRNNNSAQVDIPAGGYCPTSYTEKKKTTINESMAAVRISFTCLTNNANQMFFRIYKNGVAVGTERQPSAAGSPVTYTEDFSGVSAGDYFSIYVYGSSIYQSGYVKDLKFFYDQQITSLAGHSLTTPLATTSCDVVLMTHNS